MTRTEAIAQLVVLLREALVSASWVKLTLGAYRGAEAGLQNVFVRPIVLRAGPRLSFVYRYDTRDVTKNFEPDIALARIAAHLEADFDSGHFFTTAKSVQLDLPADGPRLRTDRARHAQAPAAGHDRSKDRFVDPRSAMWLHALDVTTAEGRVRETMAGKFRQINRFVELLQHLLADAQLGDRPRLRLVDMGCGKGYLTFAAYDYLRGAGWPDVEVVGIEARPELVALCERVAREEGLAGLRFETGTIADAAVANVDVLVALHACDTATDDAIAKGIAAGAAVIMVAPCCHRELRPHMRPPAVLAPALRHGILQARQAEFVTDSLRALLLERAGYSTKVFEFVAAEHTAMNLMIAGVKRRQERSKPGVERQIRELAAFYGIRSQQLARHLGVALAEKAAPTAAPEGSHD